MGKYEKWNAENVLKEVEKNIERLDNKKDYHYNRYGRKRASRPSLDIEDVYEELSIFDWWKNDLSLNNLKDMRAFLKTAIKLGYKGYVCFKVGVSGCANGMWAHTEESTDGYSPDSDCIYRSFTPAYTRWDAQVNDEWVGGRREEDLTLAELKKILKQKKELCEIV